MEIVRVKGQGNDGKERVVSPREEMMERDSAKRRIMDQGAATNRGDVIGERKTWHSLRIHCGYAM